MARDGVTRAVSLVLAPHYSKMSVGRYQAKIADGLRMARGSIEFAHIESYHTAPKLIQAFVDRIGRALKNWPEEERASVHVVFSAHSLPARIIESGDPYDTQVRETAQLVAAKLGLPSERWSWSYQSAGRTPEPWLGPQLYDHLPKLAERGIRNVLSVPIGFVSDHVEILFDVDIQAQSAARAHRMRLERPPALNDDPAFVSLLADLITERARRAEWQHGD
jgi:ferrochelatase